MIRVLDSAAVQGEPPWVRGPGPPNSAGHADSLGRGSLAFYQTRGDSHLCSPDHSMNLRSLLNSLSSLLWSLLICQPLMSPLPFLSSSDAGSLHSASISHTPSPPVFPVTPTCIHGSVSQTPPNPTCLKSQLPSFRKLLFLLCPLSQQGGLLCEPWAQARDTGHSGMVRVVTKTLLIFISNSNNKLLLLVVIKIPYLLNMGRCARCFTYVFNLLLTAIP